MEKCVGEKSPEVLDEQEPMEKEEESPLIAANEKSVAENQSLEKNAVNSLALLAAYDSSSDSESDSSTSSSSSSSSSSESEAEEVVIENAKTFRAEESGESGSEDSSADEKAKSRPSSRQMGVKAKGEIDMCDLPPIEDLRISVQENECIHLGKILSTVEQMVLVESKRGNVVLDLDTILFLDHGQKVLGKIFDVLGPIDQPIYCIRFNSASQITERGITVGMDVFWVSKPEHASIVVVPNLMQQKGSDASWEHDIEPPEGCLDYSDDEQERANRRTRRQRKPEEAPKRQVLRGQRRRPNPPMRAPQPTHFPTTQHWYQYPPPPVPTWGPVYVNPFAYQAQMPFTQPPPPPPPPQQNFPIKMEHEEPPPPGCN